MTRIYLAVLAVIVLGAALRLVGIGDAPPGLYPDEAVNGNDALAAIDSGDWQWFYPNNNGREGLFINAQALALDLTGEREPWVLRVVAALCGILTIPAMYLLGRAVWGRYHGLLAAALLAGSYWHVTFSRIGFRAIMAPLVLAWALALLLLGIRRLRDKERHGALMVVAGGALAGLGLHTYISFRAMAIVFLVTGGLAVWNARRRDEARPLLRAMILAGLAALLVAAPLLHHFVTHPGSFSGRAAQVSVLGGDDPARAFARNVALEAGMLVWSGDGNWRHNFPRSPALPLLLIPFFLYGFASVTCRGWRTRGRELGDAVVVVLFVAALLPAAASGEGMPHALRGILLIVPVFLMTSFGVMRAFNELHLRGMRVAAHVLLIGLVAYGFAFTAVRYPTYATRLETYHEFTTPYLETGREILQRDRSRDAYVIVPEGDVLIDGIPVAAQTVMFVTDTGTPAKRERERVFYVTDDAAVPSGAQVYDLR